MSYPARGPTRSVGIDGELRIAAGGRHANDYFAQSVKEAEGVSYPARGPTQRVGIDGELRIAAEADTQTKTLRKGLRRPAA